jgi:hypothetical protein
VGKPWARLEQNFINHQKFLALTSNAICLWLEGKNYCDMYQTDGMIPKIALKDVPVRKPQVRRVAESIVRAEAEWGFLRAALGTDRRGRRAVLQDARLP